MGRLRRLLCRGDPDTGAGDGRRWHHTDQAVSLSYFEPAPIAERVIHFSAYGRRHPIAHEAVMRFCE